MKREVDVTLRVAIEDTGFTFPNELGDHLVATLTAALAGKPTPARVVEITEVQTLAAAWVR